MAGNWAPSKRHIERKHANTRKPTKNRVKKQTFFATAENVGMMTYGEPPAPLYRHDAERFAWSLIITCLSVEKDANGQTRFLVPHFPPSWFRRSDGSYSTALDKRTANSLLETVPFHEKSKHLAGLLHNYWVEEQFKQRGYRGELIWGRIAFDFRYADPSDRELFEGVLRQCKEASFKLPESQGKSIRDGVAATLRSLHPLE
jgi:hypothetical protein